MSSREFSSPYCSAFGPYYVAVFSFQNFCMALSSNVSQLVSMIPFAELLCQTAFSAQLMQLQAMAGKGKSWETNIFMSHDEQTLRASD